MNNKSTLNPDKLSAQIGRLSLAIVSLGFISLKILGADVYNGLDGVSQEEVVFLLWVTVGGVLGAYAYALKKTICSVVAAIIFIVVMISALGMQLNKSSNQSIHSIADSASDPVDAQARSE